MSYRREWPQSCPLPALRMERTCERALRGEHAAEERKISGPSLPFHVNTAGCRAARFASGFGRAVQEQLGAGVASGVRRSVASGVGSIGFHGPDGLAAGRCFEVSQGAAVGTTLLLLPQLFSALDLAVGGSGNDGKLGDRPA